MRDNKRAQSILEFSLVSVVIIASVVSVPLYIKHGLVGRISKHGRNTADGGQNKTTTAFLAATAGGADKIDSSKLKRR